MFLTLTLILTSESLRAGIRGGPITNSANGHIYYLLTTNSWINAEAEAVQLGGHLVTINDQAENNFVLTNFSNFGGVSRILWIGLNDRQVEGTFTWVSGEESAYRRWRAGEPNNFGGSEFNVEFHPQGAADAGLWNDRAADMLNGVVEVVTGIATHIRIRTAIEISWESQTTNRYQVQWSSALATNNWFNLGSTIQGAGALQSVIDRPQEDAKRFYRVLTLP